MSGSEPSTKSIAVRENPSSLEGAICGESPEQWKAAASDASLTEDLVLTLLKRPDLPSEALVALSKNSSVSKQRKVRIGIVQHPRTPRHISLPMLRLLYTFDLMSTALAPVVAADIKRAAEGVLLSRMEMISTGEKLTLARRASGRVAGELLLDKEPRVMKTALDNARLTEAAVIKVVLRRDAPAPLVTAVCHHSKWSVGREVRIALLRNEKTPLARALEFARSLPPAMFREVMRISHLPASTKSCLMKDFEHRMGV